MFVSLFFFLLKTHMSKQDLKQALLNSYQAHAGPQTVSAHRQLKTNPTSMATTMPGQDHPYENPNYYSEFPPIPEFNCIINNATGEIRFLEGQP